MTKEELLEECQGIVEETCEKYGYDREDIEGNDSLRTVLLKAVPAMLEDSSKEDRQLFYQMLRHTPIVVVENLTEESYEDLKRKYINSEVVEEKSDLGEYGSKVGAGAYVSAPIIDENGQVAGKNSFIYIQKVISDKERNFFGTDINVSHLIHEMGHAWHAEDEQYQILENGMLKERVGTMEERFSFHKTEDGKTILKSHGVKGLFLEEGMNTIAEEQAMARYKGISLEEMRKTYGKTLIPSSYQGAMRNCVEYLLEETSKADFEEWRMHGNQEPVKENVENYMEKTNFWKNRNEEILPESKSERNYNKKREVLAKIDKPNVKDFFEKYEDVYFPDVSQMTPLEKIENVLEQYYDLGNIKYNMGIDGYRDFLGRIAYESYALINQTVDVKKSEFKKGNKMEEETFEDTKNQIAGIIGNVKSGDVERVTKETKEGVKSLRIGEKVQEEKE